MLQKVSHSGGGVPHISVKLPMLGGGGGGRITFVVVRKAWLERTGAPEGTYTPPPPPREQSSG